MIFEIDEYFLAEQSRVVSNKVGVEIQKSINNAMILYKTKTKKLSGTSYKEVIKKARKVFHQIEKRSKRSAYLKSAYFGKKIFINLFCEHINQKSPRDRIRRLKLLPCAIELIENSKQKPTSKPNPNKKNEILHRFGGITSMGELFYVQIKEKVKTKRRDFISVFPEELSKK